MTREENASSELKLGLIGDNIAQSRAPLLHRLAGAQNGVSVTYDRLVPPALKLSFEEVFANCVSEGYRGINITYPYKETVTTLLEIDDPLVRSMGAANTVIFDGERPRGYNTDYTGFMAAYERIRGSEPPGSVLMIGTGGVGRAVAFGLVGLGVTTLTLVDRDIAKAEALAQALEVAAPDISVKITSNLQEAANGATGLINCTPVGMVGYDGTPLPAEHMTGAEWAFDAVYTPTDTKFLTDAAAAGLSVISGWELFFYQGVHAWKHFSGLPLDEVRLRRRLLENTDGK